MPLMSQGWNPRAKELLGIQDEPPAPEPESQSQTRLQLQAIRKQAEKVISEARNQIADAENALSVVTAMEATLTPEQYTLLDEYQGSLQAAISALVPELREKLSHMRAPAAVSL
jgi:parvulin-like peptidyl-prolyl isomerase